MMAFTHVLTSVSLWAATVPLAGFPPTLAGAAAAALGGLVPDLDHPNSFLGKRVYPMGLGLLALAGVAQGVLGWPLSPALWWSLGLLVAVPKVLMLLGHRGITHSGVAIAAFGAAAVHFYSVGRFLEMSFFIGCLGHLVGDWATRGGIPLLWPKARRFRMPGAFRVGGLAEGLTAVLLVLWLWQWLALTLDGTVPAWTQ